MKHTLYAVALSIGGLLAGCGPETMMDAGLPVHMAGCNSSVLSPTDSARCFNRATHRRPDAPIGSSEGGD